MEPSPPKQSWKEWKINANNCSEKKSEQAPPQKKNKMGKHEGRGINTGSQVDRQVGGRRGARCQVRRQWRSFA